MKPIGLIAVGGGAVLAAAVGFVAVSWARTEADIAAFQSRIAEIGALTPAPVLMPEELATLPEPVQRYFAFVFTGPVPRYGYVRYAAEGQFRIPQTEDFNFTTAEQTIAIGEPALMFSATTPVLPGIWARAYDFFADGEMEMKAKILSTVTVVDESETPELNRISLRRWLLESALFPQALLPGGPVSWEPIDEASARDR